MSYRFLRLRSFYFSIFFFILFFISDNFYLSSSLILSSFISILLLSLSSEFLFQILYFLVQNLLLASLLFLFFCCECVSSHSLQLYFSLPHEAVIIAALISLFANSNIYAILGWHLLIFFSYKIFISWFFICQVLLEYILDILLCRLWVLLKSSEEYLNFCLFQ